MITESVTEHPNGFVGRADVLQALDQILASRPFRTSNQCSGLLRYIVEHTLAGEDNLLRERVIGAELFGRPADYETSEDPIVRLRVSDVRKRLAQYYLSARVRREVQIEVPSGSYRATFHWNAEAPATRSLIEAKTLAEELISDHDPALPTGLAIHPAAVEAEPIEPRDYVPLHSRRGVRAAVAAGAFLLLTTLCILAVLHLRSPDRALRKFWAPWIGSSKPVLISIGSNAVYRFQWDYVDRYAREHGLEASGQEFYIPLKPGDLIPADELQPAYNSFVAISDVSAISDITTVLTKQSVPFEERFAEDISFAEVRSNPSVLVGGFNNPMTIELTKNLPFVMRSGNEVIETQKPNRKWTLHIQIGSHDTADYAIVTRLAGNTDEPPLMSVAGLGGFGTQGAARLIADPSAIAALVSNLPRGWERKNLQIVISLKISDFKIVSREVVATRVW